MRKSVTLFTVLFLLLLGATSVWAETVIRSLPHTITSAGLYVLDDNESSTGHGIIVNADNVTIDLRGYTITGPGGLEGYYGIHVASGYENVEVRNGTVTDFDYGVRAESGTSSIRVINLRVSNNDPQGIWLLGSNNLVKDCTISSNGNIGMFSGYGSLVTGNNVSNNANYGIQVDDGSLVMGNTTSYNRVGIDAYFGVTVKNNTVFGNTETGILLEGNDLVDGNTAYGNDTSSGEYPNMSTCASCTFGTNHAP